MPSIDAAKSNNASAPTLTKDILRDSQKRVSQFSYIRVFACFAIVMLHCLNTSRAYYKDVMSNSELSYVYSACSMLMWAVPCFLMVTGALLLDTSKIIPPKKLFGKYIRRMIVALLVFTLIFTMMKYADGDLQGSNGFFDFYITNLIKGQAMPHLWYLYLMIILYILIPLFKMMLSRWSDAVLCGFTVGVLLVASLLPYVWPASQSVIRLPSGIVYAVYLFIGYLIYRHNPDLKISVAMLAACSIALLVLSYRKGTSGSFEAVENLIAYSSPLVLLQSASIFSVMLRIRADAGRWINSIDECSFGIYLIHVIFVRLAMKNFGFNPYDFGPFAFLPMAILFFATSYCLAWVIKRLTGSAII